jgi:hypothetical protein
VERDARWDTFHEGGYRAPNDLETQTSTWGQRDLVLLQPVLGYVDHPRARTQNGDARDRPVENVIVRKDGTLFLPRPAPVHPIPVDANYRQV